VAVDRAVVTGATGFIGWHLCERLRDAGWSVRAVVRPGTAKPVPPGVERHESALVASQLGSAFDSTAVVVHVAGTIWAPNEATFFRVNAGATREVAQAASQAGARLVYVSSQAAAGPSGPDTLRRETDVPQPCSAYGRSKLAGELAIRQVHDLRWTILRPVAVYGPMDRNFLAVFRLARAGIFPVPSSLATPYMLIHVSDLVAAIECAIGSAAAVHETMFIGHPSVHSTESFLEAVAAAVGRPCRPFVMPRLLLRALAAAGTVAMHLGRPPVLDHSRLRELTAGRFICDVGRARAVLGFEAAIDLPEGFARTAAWYREQGLLRPGPQT
jgi:nucleoside-diphosphate-sugar epimerase